LLSRIPAVKWAFTRLRSSPQGGIEGAPVAASASPAIVAEATPALDGISAEPLHHDAETVAVDEVSVSSIESEPVDAPEPVISDKPSFEAPTEVEPVITDEASVSPVDVTIAAVDAPVLMVDDEPTSGVVVDVEPIAANEACAALAGDEVPAANVVEGSIDNGLSASVAVTVEPIPAKDPAPVAAESASDVTTNMVPEPDLAAYAPNIPAAPQTRARITEPVDRATLIRQR
jgi:hypothetical protein